MIPFFPALEEDELLYSVLARYRRLAAWNSWSTALDALFGRRHVVAAHDLPGHLQALCSKVMPNVPGSVAVKRLIDRSTLLPYYISAASPGIREKAIASAAAGGGSSHFSLGLSASCVPRVPALRFCSLCTEDDIAAHGFTWWRRSHQLPGTRVCLRHEAFLRETPSSFSHLGRHEFLLADARSCPGGGRFVADGDREALALYMRIARAEERVLRTGELEISHVARRRKLAAAGLMRSRQRVNQAEMAGRAAGCFAPVGISLPMVVSPEAIAKWMPGLVRSARGGVHPLLHVLMDVFLASQPSVASKVATPFGSGPWPCLNPLASHSGQPVVTNLSSYRTKGRLVGRFECKCGYVYSRSQSRDGTLTKSRYYRYGALLEPELRRLIATGASLRATSRAVGLDPNTVAAEARRLELPVTWRTGKQTFPANSSATRESHTAATAAVRKRVPASRRDWPACDSEMLARCNRGAAALMKLEPPTKLTYAAIERAAVSKAGWIRARATRLPRTMAFIGGIVETTAAYRRRRAAFVIGQTDGAAEPWRVMRAAGLTGADLPMIRELIEGMLSDAVHLAA